MPLIDDAPAKARSDLDRLKVGRLYNKYKRDSAGRPTEKSVYVPAGKTCSQWLGDIYGMSEATVRRYGKFAALVDQHADLVASIEDHSMTLSEAVYQANGERPYNSRRTKTSYSEREGTIFTNALESIRNNVEIMCDHSGGANEESISALRKVRAGISRLINQYERSDK